MNKQLITPSLWITLLLSSSILFSFTLACAMPFVALATIAALTLNTRQSFALLGSAWAVNQFIGFSFQNYPVDVNTLLWGAVLGATAIAVVSIAQTAMKIVKGGVVSQAVCGFLAAFCGYEVILFAASFGLGGVENFSLVIQSQIFALNVAAGFVFFALAFITSGLGYGHALNKNQA